MMIAGASNNHGATDLNRRFLIGRRDVAVNSSFFGGSGRTGALLMINPADSLVQHGLEFIVEVGCNVVNIFSLGNASVELV